LAQARPKIVFDVRGNASVHWVDDIVTGKDDLLSVLAWALGPQQLAAAFARQLEQEPERADALSPTERERRISELSATLLSLERREEEAIMLAADQASPSIAAPMPCWAPRRRHRLRKRASTPASKRRAGLPSPLFLTV
jgi:hypothetical protein